MRPQIENIQQGEGEVLLRSLSSWFKGTPKGTRPFVRWSNSFFLTRHTHVQGVFLPPFVRH